MNGKLRPKSAMITQGHSVLLMIDEDFSSLALIFTADNCDISESHLHSCVRHHGDHTNNDMYMNLLCSHRLSSGDNCEDHSNIHRHL